MTIVLKSSKTLTKQVRSFVDVIALIEAWEANVRASFMDRFRNNNSWAFRVFFVVALCLRMAISFVIALALRRRAAISLSWMGFSTPFSNCFAWSSNDDEGEGRDDNKERGDERRRRREAFLEAYREKATNPISKRALSCALEAGFLIREVRRVLSPTTLKSLLKATLATTLPLRDAITMNIRNRSWRGGK